MSSATEFWTHVDKDGPAGCWLWTGLVLESGYGRCYFGEQNDRWAHRWAYRLAVGPIPPGYHVDHLCFVRRCVNPAHLEAVTPGENARRAAARRPVRHGESAGYERGCRCQECCEASRAYTKNRRRARREALARGEIQVVHGRARSYGEYGCRCPECREAAIVAWTEERRRRGVKPMNAIVHGTTSMYTKHRCRCDVCRRRWAEYWREHRAKKRAQQGSVAS